MNDRRTHVRAPRLLLAALAVACALPHPGAAQSIAEQIGDAAAEAVAGLDRFVSGPPPARTPDGVRECGSLYGAEARTIARRRDLLDSAALWYRESYEIIRRVGPLPVCFAFGHDTLTSNQSRRLLEVNNYYLQRHPETYLLTGYTDRQERDAGLARRRAEEIQKESPMPACRYHVAGRRGEEMQHYRRVFYERADVPGARNCRR